MLGSWGLSLFVLFERVSMVTRKQLSSWGLSLFVLFEQDIDEVVYYNVLED